MAYNNNYNNNNNSDEEGGSNLQPLTEEAKKELAKLEPGLDEVYYDQFFLMTKPNKNGKFKISINKAGLFWKLENLHPEHEMITKPVTGEVLKELKEALGYTPDAKVIIMESTITIFGEHRDRKFNAHGSVTPDNIKYRKGTKTPANAHLIELAETRADKRAILKVTRCGYALANNDEDIPEEEDIDGNANELREQARKKFFALCNQQGYSKREDYIQLCSAVLKREVETTKTLTFAEFEEIISYMEGKRNYPPSPLPEENKTEEKPQFDISPKPEQLEEIQALYKYLNWGEKEKKRFFDNYNNKSGKNIYSETEFDHLKAKQFIAYLKNRQPEPLSPPTVEPPPVPQVIDDAEYATEPDLNISLEDCEVPF